MASTIPRQPFAPLDGARLANLTSLKNRQNAFATPSAGKRKAESIDTDDSENVDPSLFAKRSKGADSFFSNDYVKPSTFLLTKASSAGLLPSKFATPLSNKIVKPISRPRTIAQPRSPASKLNTTAISRTPLSAPAGRSPTRASKRSGLLSTRRRTTTSFTRVDPPAFGASSRTGAAAPFSLDAALRGTVSSYASRHGTAAPAAAAAPVVSHCDDSLDSSWNFEIHEDTPEQEMTNLLQHSTCVLDISSDEESEQKAVREQAEGRDKENIPPADDVSQVRAPRNENDAMMMEKTRGPLSEMNAADYYADGYDESSFILVPGEYVDEDAETVHGGDEEQEEPSGAGPRKFEFAPELNVDVAVEALMGNRDSAAPKAALLRPIDGTGESFELWESGSSSGSSKDEAEPETSANPSPAAATLKDESAAIVQETADAASEPLSDVTVA